MDSAIQIIDPTCITDEDLELIAAMDAYVPRTKFKRGDLAVLRGIPDMLRIKHEKAGIPQFWQIRFAVSMWSYELMVVLQGTPGLGMDAAISRIQVPPSEYDRPMIYAHAFPHGENPDTAEWFTELELRRVNLRAPTEDWPVLLDYAKAPYAGPDTENLCFPGLFAIAPDYYAHGENIGKPFPCEEATYHTAALLGLESAMSVPIRPGLALDRDHDIFDVD